MSSRAKSDLTTTVTRLVEPTQAPRPAPPATAALGASLASLSNAAEPAVASNPDSPLRTGHDLKGGFGLRRGDRGVLLLFLREHRRSKALDVVRLKSHH